MQFLTIITYFYDVAGERHAWIPNHDQIHIASIFNVLVTPTHVTGRIRFYQHWQNKILNIWQEYWESYSASVDVTRTNTQTYPTKNLDILNTCIDWLYRSYSAALPKLTFCPILGFLIFWAWKLPHYWVISIICHNIRIFQLSVPTRAVNALA